MVILFTFMVISICFCCFDTFRMRGICTEAPWGVKLCGLKKKTFVDDSAQVRKLKWGERGGGGGGGGGGRDA